MERETLHILGKQQLAIDSRRQVPSYRDRCYQGYVSTHWQYTHSFSEQSFEMCRQVARKLFLRFLPPDKSARILDVGCGAGHFLYFLQKEGYSNSLGIDLSSEQLDVAIKMGVRNTQKADLFDYLPEQRESFDIIVANDIIEHLRKEEVLAFLDLIYLSLKPSGRTIIRTLNTHTLFGSYILFKDFTHESGFTPESLTQVMRVCRFEEVEIYGEGPVSRDFRSTLRATLWWSAKQLAKLYLTIENGTGRGLGRNQDILEPLIFAVGKK